MRVRFRESLQAALRACARGLPSLVRHSRSGLALALIGCAAHSPKPPATPLQVVIPDVCARLKGGPPGTSPNLDLAKAHALARYFGVETDPRDADKRLSDALESKTDYRPVGSCAARAEASVLEDARVTLENDVAVVRPGHGEVVIPPSARAIAIDVRALSETDEARKAVERLFPLVLRGDVMLPALEHRTCNGQPDEGAGELVAYHRIDQYECVRTETRTLVHGEGRALPIAVVVSPRLTPVAAWTAVMLRGAADAFIVGADIPLEIAESRWVGLGAGGLAIRVSRFRGFADVLVANAPNLATIDWAGPRRRGWGPGARKPIENLQRVYFDTREPTPRKSDGRAALIVAHGAVRTFFPYQDEIEEDLDARFEEALTYLRGNRSSTRQALRRYAQALHDGHAGVFGGRPSNSGSLVRLVRVAGDEMAVKSTHWPDIDPGDVVTAINNEPIAMWLEEGARFKSGSPQHVRSFLGLSLVEFDTPIRIRKPNGEERTVVLELRRDLKERRSRAPAPHVPGIAYVDLSKVDDKDVAPIRESLRSAHGVILDMRGSPTRSGRTILRDVCSEEARGPRMAELHVTPWTNERGPWQNPQPLEYWANTRVPFDGPAVMLVGADTQAHAEHLVTFFRSTKRGKLIGSPTSGTNGTITGVRLPGNFGLTFTGVAVRQPDGARFHGIGHIPDIFVEPTASDLANNRDPVLERAITELKP